MKYFLDVSTDALYDIQQGVDYYNDQQKGLGKRFASLINKTFTNIKKMPLSASFAFDNTRYKVVKKFPYIVLYRVQENTILIARVFNTHQQPIY